MSNGRLSGNTKLRGNAGRPVSMGSLFLFSELFLWEVRWLFFRVLNSRLSGPGSGPGRGHCVVFLGKTLYSHNASLHPGV